MSIEVNMTKAKVIWKDKWRAVRKEKLEALDVDFMRAVEANDSDKQSEVATKKQELRDVTDTDLSNVSTPDNLKQIWPTCLGDKPEELK